MTKSKKINKQKYKRDKEGNMM